VFTQALKRLAAVGLLLISGWAVVGGPLAWGQTEINRKAQTKVVPVYPELARRMKITGVVKILVTVSPNGSVKDARVVGGHPVLANAALEAVKKWRFQAGPVESAQTVEFHFDPIQ
jgi:TonB family protein